MSSNLDAVGSGDDGRAEVPAIVALLLDEAGAAASLSAEDRSVYEAARTSVVEARRHAEVNEGLLQLR
jgi:hypothetical protein